MKKLNSRTVTAVAFLLILLLPLQVNRALAIDKTARGTAQAQAQPAHLLAQAAQAQAQPAQGQPLTAAPDTSPGQAQSKEEEKPNAALPLNETKPETLSTSSPRMVLKNGGTLLVLNKTGMVDHASGSPYGLFEDDTRFLSRWQLQVNGKQPTFLSSFSRHGYDGEFLYTTSEDILIERDVVVLNGMSEKITIRSFKDKPIKMHLTVKHKCDFRDMFEVRGIKRTKFGQLLGTALLEQKAVSELTTEASRYRGVDLLDRTTFVTAESPRPTRTTTGEFDYDISLPARGKQTIELRVDTSNTPEGRRPGNSHTLYTYDAALQEANSEFNDWNAKVPQITTDWVQLADMVHQSLTDLYLLQQSTPKGKCLAAGLPWYSCAFGRDQCVTSLQTLPFIPELSLNAIKVLAAYQGKVHDPVTEEEPGRIMHELRLGDMARSKEIAFRPYYGTVDATPLWLLLLSRYVDATGDLELAKTLWPNVEAALAYLEKCASETGFLYYGGKDGAALSNQAWKDSGDSIMHSDGKLATPPIAVCEVQGYLYDAYVGTARLATKLGRGSTADSLNVRAKSLKENFKKSFWLPKKGIVALALDGTAQPCDVVASNAGHLLSTGILDDEMANAISERLLKEDMFSGWGIRTLSSTELRYNPMSYHNGSIWPHDNAFIVEGLAARGRMEDSCKVMEALIQSARTATDARLPELFCGFPRNAFPAPVPYAVSCVPQAWAAGSLLQMLKSILGISLVDNRIHIAHPSLPPSINLLTLNELRSGDSTATVTFTRDSKTGAVSVNSSSDAVIVEH